MKPIGTSTTSGVNAAATRNCDGVAFSPDGQKLLVSDSGNDRVTAQVSAGKDLVLNGGGDFDTLTDLGSIGFEKTEVIEFEVIQ